MKRHIDWLGYLYIALGVLGLLTAAFLFLVIAGGGLISGDPEAIFVTGLVATILAVFLTVISLPGIIVGYGLLKRRSWARILGLVLGFLNLFNIPLGTLLGVYTFWVLLQDEAEAQFAVAR